MNQPFKGLCHEICHLWLLFPIKDSTLSPDSCQEAILKMTSKSEIYFTENFFLISNNLGKKAGVDCLKVATPYHQMIVHKLGYLEELTKN